MTPAVKLGAFVAGLVVALAIGVGVGSFFDLGESQGRRIDIEMRDTAYSPTTIVVKAGEKVELRFHNAGQAPHDAFIGDAAAQATHEREMRAGDGGHGHEHGGTAVVVEPGATETIRYTFDRDDDGTIIGCHEFGHYAAGMRLTVRVS